MVRTEVEYQAVEESDGSPKKEDSGRNKLEEEKEEEEKKKTQTKKKKRKRKEDKDCAVIEEKDEEDGDDEEELKTDSNDADSNNNPSPTRRPNIIRRTMSYLASLPRKLFTYVREVLYSPRDHRWTQVGHDDSEESDWSSNEDVGTPRSNKHKRSTARTTERHRPKTNKAAPPPIAPKPKKKDATNGHASGSGSSNPPSLSDTTSPDTTPEISFDDIPIDSPQLKTYKRIHGPQGRRKPQRFSNQNEIRQSEIRHEADGIR